jgi:hypothetical protein
VDAASPLVAAGTDAPREALWVDARSGEGGDLARLADHEGVDGLIARAGGEPEWRLVALRAMAFAPEPGAFAGLPWLAEAARAPEPVAADAALDSAIDLSARPRRALDPEDAAEMKAGCDALLSLATDANAQRGRRVKALRALRMLVDRGCVDPARLPTDLDAH